VGGASLLLNYAVSVHANMDEETQVQVLSVLSINFLTFITGQHSGTDPSPGHFGTDPSPGHFGTDPSPGHFGTDPSPGHFGTDPKLLG
jgi:hypothetical protein